MFSFIMRKLATVIPIFIGITLVAFFLIRLVPGDPIEVMVGERRLDPEMHAALVQRMGLDKPLYEQYWKYVTDLAHGNLG
jgi:dipeptide transport system permease protein